MEKITEIDKNQKLEKLLNDFSEFDLGKKLLKWADENNVEICIDIQGDQGYYDYKNNKIIISYHIDDVESVISLVHELRHAWQHHNIGLDKYDGSFYPSLIFKNFAEADAISFQNTFALMAAEETGNKEYYATIDRCYNEVINKSLQAEHSIEEFRFNLFNEYFTNSDSIRIEYEEKYIEKMQDIVEQGNFLPVMLAKEGKENFVNLKLSDLKLFGASGFKEGCSNYLEERLDLSNKLYTSFYLPQLDSLVKKSESILKVTSPRKLVF